MSLREWMSGKIDVQLLLAFAFGVTFLVILLLLVLLVPNPTSFQAFVFRVVLSLAAAGATAMIPGLLKVKVSTSRRWTITAAGAIAAFTIVYLLNPPDLVQPDSRPKVLLMDSMLPGMVFNEQSRLAGKTNADDVIEILDDLPVTLSKELVNPEWDREEAIYQENPQLIIIHASAFYDRTHPEDLEKRFDALIRYMQKAQTKFLIYSRAQEFSDEVQKKADYLEDYPFLEERIEVMHVNPDFSRPVTSQALKSLVKSMLALDEK